MVLGRRVAAAGRSETFFASSPVAARVNVRSLSRGRLFPIHQLVDECDERGALPGAGASEHTGIAADVVAEDPGLLWRWLVLGHPSAGVLAEDDLMSTRRPELINQCRVANAATERVLDSSAVLLIAMWPFSRLAETLRDLKAP
jgi:hypothetical protein